MRWHRLDLYKVRSAKNLSQWKNFKNRSVFDEVMPEILQTLFFPDTVYMSVTLINKVAWQCQSYEGRQTGRSLRHIVCILVLFHITYDSLFSLLHWESDCTVVCTKTCVGNDVDSLSSLSSWCEWSHRHWLSGMYGVLQLLVRHNRLCSSVVLLLSGFYVTSCH